MPYERYGDQDVDGKVVLMGNSGVGKTSLLQRYTKDIWDPKHTSSTTGALFVTKKVKVEGGGNVRLQLWDTAGQERFRSMAPMYYRGAHAALLLYDLTSEKTFLDVKGWIEELRKNCPPELIIFIVGSKADLTQYRQVSSDLARLSLHTWFPPPRPRTPPPPPAPPSTLSYIRPRFTSFTSLRSQSPNTQPLVVPEEPSFIEPPPARVPPLKRTHTGSGVPSRSNVRPSISTVPLARSHSGTAGASRSPLQSRFGSPYAVTRVGWGDSTESNSIEEDEDLDEDEGNDQEWGLHKGMELFEVSAKDSQGISDLFGALIAAIIARKDVIEHENELKKRDSVFLSSVSEPGWAAQAEEEEARNAKANTPRWTCCQI